MIGLPRERGLLLLIVLGYLMLGVTYSIVVPIFETPDEPAHFAMVQYLATHELALPPQTPGTITPWGQEGSQPPLYYLAAAILVSGINTSDFLEVRRLNPHADIGIVRPDRNANIVVHRAEMEQFPWRGSVLAVHIIRFFSVLLGAGTVLATFALCKLLFPTLPVVALGAAAFTAFLPQFIFISASVSNDSAANLLSALLTLAIARLLVYQQLTVRVAVVMGVFTGLGLLAKLNLGVFVPLVALIYLFISVRQRRFKALLMGGLISGGLTILIAGWWYFRNWQLYSDPTALNIFLSIVGRRDEPASLAQLWSERESIMRSFWGLFGHMNVPMPDWTYAVFTLLAVIAVFGLVLSGVMLLRRRQLSQRWLSGGFSLLLIALTFIFFLRWTAETPASQGRLLFGALPALCLWLVYGWTKWLPRSLHPVLVGAVSGGLCVVAAVVPFATIQPMYAPPQILPAARTGEAFIGDGQITLGETRVLTEQVQPGDEVLIELDWQITAHTQHDYSLFVHLVTPDGVIVAQRDVYPAGGVWATSDLAGGTAWRNPVAITLPPTAFAPQLLSVVVGWYDRETDERLRLTDGSDMLRVGSVELMPPAGDVPNPVHINFGNQLALIGYNVSDLSLSPGQPFAVTLYWQALGRIPYDYTVFAHVVDPATTTLYAGSDAQPAANTRPTSGWTAGEIIEDVHMLTVSDTAPPEQFLLEVGLYRQINGEFIRLYTIADIGNTADDHAILTPVRILAPEAKQP